MSRKTPYTIYVGVNQAYRGDTGDFFQVSADCLERDEDLKFSTEDAAEHVRSAIYRAYYKGKRDAKKELGDWINDK